jgi:undecaprenyl-phosphate 4-deoxy-4-formamido-L-arabinose transferase
MIAESTGLGAAPELSIVIPVYRSASCLIPLADAIDAALKPTGMIYEVVLVNDGSPDDSWNVVDRLCRSRPGYTGIDLRRNFGQDNAIMTGLRAARGRLIAIMDDDLQHDPRDLPALVEALEREESDVVYARFEVQKQALWKRLGSWFNGKFAEWVIEKPRGIYLSPYKVIRGELADLICQYEGPEPYVDGLLFQFTTRVSQITVEHNDRYAGRSGYSFRRSVAVWLRLATSFSVKPLRLVVWAGFGCAALGGLIAVYVIGYRLLYPENFERAVAGWASLMVTNLLTAAARMVFLGVVGEYAGRTYITVCNKPQAAVRKVVAAMPAAAAHPEPSHKFVRQEAQPWVSV